MKKLIFMLAAISVSATLWGQAITDQSFLDGRRTFEPLGTIAQQTPGSGNVSASPTSTNRTAAQVGQDLDNHRDPALAGKVSDVEDQGINLNDNTNAGILSRLSFLEYLHGLKSATAGPSQPSTGFIPQQAGDDQVIIIGYRGNQKDNLVIPVRSEDGNVKGTVIGIGPGALANMQLSGKLTFEEGTQVATIAEEAFANNYLVEVSIPSTVTEIKSGAFSNNLLTSVDIPNSLTELADSIFSNNRLPTVTIPNTITLIKHHAFSNNQLSALQIPNSVTEIDNSAFENNKIANLSLPTTITTILDSAFATNELKTLDISKLDNLTVLSYGIFSHNKLTKITLHKTAITEIGASAFSDNQLTEVEIPVSVTRIEKGAFSVNKLAKVLFVGDTTRQATTSLGEIEGSSLTYIGPGAFAYNQLPQISIPNSVITIDSQAFLDNQLTRIGLGKVETIGAGAFQLNRLASVTIPNTVERIGEKAFLGTETGNNRPNQNKLTQVTLGEAVVDIGPYAFANNALTQLAIPNSVQNIGESAFQNNQIADLVLGTKGSDAMFIRRNAFATNQLKSLVLPDIPYDPSTKKGGLYLWEGAFTNNTFLQGTPPTPARIIIPGSTNPRIPGAAPNAPDPTSAQRSDSIRKVFDTAISNSDRLIYL